MPHFFNSGECTKTCRQVSDIEETVPRIFNLLQLRTPPHNGFHILGNFNSPMGPGTRHFVILLLCCYCCDSPDHFIEDYALSLQNTEFIRSLYQSPNYHCRCRQPWKNIYFLIQNAIEFSSWAKWAMRSHVSATRLSGFTTTYLLKLRKYQMFPRPPLLNESLTYRIRTSQIFQFCFGKVWTCLRQLRSSIRTKRHQVWFSHGSQIGQLPTPSMPSDVSHPTIPHEIVPSLLSIAPLFLKPSTKNGRFIKPL